MRKTILWTQNNLALKREIKRMMPPPRKQQGGLPHEASSFLFSVLVLLTLPFSVHAQTPTISATFIVDPVANMTTDHLVIILTGRYTCGPQPQPQPPTGGTFAGVSGQVSQAAGRDIAEGGFGFTPVRDAVEHTFQTNVLADNIPWRGGLARVRANLVMQLCDEFFNCQVVNAGVDMKVSIRGGGWAAKIDERWLTEKNTGTGRD